MLRPCLVNPKKRRLARAARASHAKSLASAWPAPSNAAPSGAKGETMAKILCVLYDDPSDGFPPRYARDEIPRIDSYPDGQRAPTPQAIDFRPGELLGSVSGE